MADLNETFAEVVARVGADLVFGVPGGGANLDLIDACARHDVQFILMHTEAAAAIAAATYGRLHGAPSAAIATRGPGAASAVNGAATATLDRMPLLLVTDTVTARDRASVSHQRIDQPAMLRPVCKWSGTVGAADTARVAERCVQLAAAGPPGAVHVELDPTVDGDAPPPLPAPPGILEDLSSVEDRVGGADQPVVIVGVGASTEPGAVRTAVEDLGWPVLTTYQAAGIVPTCSPVHAGPFTNSAFDHRFLESADLVLAVGLDPVELLPGPFPSPAPVVSLCPWPHEAPLNEAAIEVLGPLGPALARIRSAARRRGVPDARSAQRRDAIRDVLEPVGDAFGPLHVVHAVESALPAAAAVTVDAGAHFLPIMAGLAASESSSVLISNGLATMGYAVPAAIAAALARPGRPVAALTGDGGLGMVLAELETIARLQLPVTVIVFNDSELSLIGLKQRPGGVGEVAVRYSDSDFAAVAAGLGLDAAVVASAEDLERRLSGGWDRPRLIDAHIDPSEYRRLYAALRG